MAKYLPAPNMKIYDTHCPTQGATPEQVLNPLSALEILEGQVALVHHIMAFEEVNPATHILAPTGVDSKRVTYALRHNHDLSLGRYNDALFENINRELQAFRWAPHKILGFLPGNTKSRLRIMSSFVVCTMTTFRASTGTSACRLSKDTLGCQTQPLLRLSESFCHWIVAEPLATSFTPSATRIGKASKSKGWLWARLDTLVSPAASRST